MGDPNYAAGKFQIAVDSLVGHGDLQTRILNALLSGLHVAFESDMPEHLVKDYRFVKELVTRHGTYENSVRQLTDEEASEVALRIVHIAFELTDGE
jgi:hypothetical protein